MKIKIISLGQSNPNFIAEVVHFFNQKIKTLQFHVSQQSKSYMSENSIENFHTFYDLGDNSERFFEIFAIQSLVDLDRGNYF